MRRSLLLPLIMIGSQVQGQLIEVADQRNSDITWRRIMVMDGHLLVGAYAYGGGAGNSLGQRYCTLYDGTGQELWSVSSSINLAHPYTGSMAPDGNGGFYLLGPVDGCDYTAETRLMHFGPNGELLSDLVVSDTTMYSALFPAGPGNIMGLAGWNSLLFMTPDGMHVSQWPLHYSFSHRGSWANELLYLAHGTQVMRYDPVTGPVDTLTLPTPVIDITSNENLVLILTGEELLALDPIQGTIDQWPLPATSSPPLGFIPGHGTLHILTTTGVLAFHDRSIDEVFPIALLPGQVLREAVIHADKLYTTSNVVVNGRSSGLLRSHDMQGAAIQHAIDVAVDEVVVDSSWVLHVNGNLYKQLADLRITLTNQGAEVIDKVMLSLDISTMAWDMCTVPRSTQLAEGLALQPGSSTVVEMPGHTLAYGHWPPGSIVQTETCVVAQSPNDLADRAPADNVACAEATAVGVQELLASPISIHPNPFMDQITLSGIPRDATHITIADAAGRSISQVPVVHREGSHTIALDGLPPGAYHVTITMRGGHWSRTMVKLP